MNPIQKIHNDIRRIAVDIIGEDNVWSYNPPAGTPYPFIRIGEVFFRSRRLHKEDLNGDMQVTVHVWHDSERERGTVYGYMSEIEDAVSEHFGVQGEDITSQIIDDNTTGIILLHGVVDVNIKNYK